MSTWTRCSSVATRSNSEDLWHLMYVNSLLAQRSGPQQRPISGRRHGALWDIKGKIAGLPVVRPVGRQEPRGGDGLPPRRRPQNPRRSSTTCAATETPGSWPSAARWAATAGVTKIGRDVLTLDADLESTAGEAFPGAYYDPDAYARATVELF